MQKLDIFIRALEEKFKARRALADELDCQRSLKALCNMSEESRVSTLMKIQEQQAAKIHQLRRRFSTNDYEPIKEIGSGAFGLVTLVRCKRTGERFALKQIRKDGMLKKNHRDRMLAERNLLADLTTEWIVTLHCTFQDQQNLYMVMEYLPGGDLMSHLVRLDSFPEDTTRFYIAELTEAVHAVHRLGFIHRDIKPDNIVLTRDGHLKLIDFGLCKFDPSVRIEAAASDDHVVLGSSRYSTRLGHWSRAQVRSSVGTPQYMAPEVLQKLYDHTSDFWSIGMIAYECLMGGTPFYDEDVESRPNKKPSVKRILHKVANFKQFLPIPFPGKRISPDAVSFLNGLLCEAPQRMRYDQIRSHAFFKPLNWKNLRQSRAPIVPVIARSPDSGPSPQLPLFKPLGMQRDPNMDFVGYTFNRASPT